MNEARNFRKKEDNPAELFSLNDADIFIMALNGPHFIVTSQYSTSTSKTVHVFSA